MSVRDILGARKEVRGDSRFRAKREQLATFEGLSSESHGQNLALAALYVPHSLDSDGRALVRRGLLWVVREVVDDGELRPWHFIYEGREGGDDGERASGSPVFCSWLPNVMSVSPSSASELLSTRWIQRGVTVIRGVPRS